MEIVSMGLLAGKKIPFEDKYQLKAGFNNMLLDLSMFCSSYMLEHKEECYEKYLIEKAEGKHDDDEEAIFMTNEPERMEELAERYHLPYLRSAGIQTTVAKAPTLLYDTERTDLDFLVQRLASESIQLAQKMGASYVIIEPLIKNIQEADDMDRNKQFYLSFAQLAKKLGVTVLLKNYYNTFNGHYLRSSLSDQYELKTLLDSLNTESGSDVFGLCLDVGVCNLLGQNMYEICNCLGSRIKAVFVRENDGVSDASLLPFTAVNNRQHKFDWLNLIRGLRLVQFDGPVIFGFDDTLYAHSHLLWPEIYRLAKQTADYLIWQISIEKTIKKYNKRVLFGAGNMCRNYMKCYGSEYKPLFTCDNNADLWGTTFEGLEIRNPSALLELPPDCAILICNIYYDEIEHQLRDMGVKNPIERFNDEYMPSMYTDRFDAEKREVR